MLELQRFWRKPTELPDPPMLEQPETDERMRGWLHFAGLVVLTVAAVVLCYIMARPFLAAIASSIALAVLFVPLQNALEKRGLNPSLAATITVFMAIALIAAPLMLLGEQLVKELGYAAVALQRVSAESQWKQLLLDFPKLQSVIFWISDQVDLPRLIGDATASLTAIVKAIVQASGAQIFGTIVTVYFLFFALRDRKAALAWLGRFTPLSKRHSAALSQRIAGTIRATVAGTLTVSAVQGTLGGLMFWTLGLPAPLLWGVAMGVAAIVPVLGTFVVWLPAALFLLLTGATLNAAILFVWGLLIVGMIDNLLYPVLVGTQLKTHTVPTFIALVGGIFVFGVAGLIIGPVIFTITSYLLEYWSQATHGVVKNGEG